MKEGHGRVQMWWYVVVVAQSLRIGCSKGFSIIGVIHASHTMHSLEQVRVRTLAAVHYMCIILIYNAGEEKNGRVIRVIGTSFNYILHAELMTTVGMEAIVVQRNNDYCSCERAWDVVSLKSLSLCSFCKAPLWVSHCAPDFSLLLSTCSVVSCRNLFECQFPGSRHVVWIGGRKAFAKILQ